MFVEGLHKNYFAKTLFRQLTTILVRHTKEGYNLANSVLLCTGLDTKGLRFDNQLFSRHANIMSLAPWPVGCVLFNFTVIQSDCSLFIKIKYTQTRHVCRFKFLKLLYK